MELIEKINKSIKHTKHLLGAPVRRIELTDDQYKSLYEVAMNDFDLYHLLSRTERTLPVDAKDYWVSSYFTALCKETLGRIRGKFSGKVKEDGKLDYESLLNEAYNEKERLINLLA